MYVNVYVHVCVCVKDRGMELKNLSVLFVSTAKAPQAYDRDTSDEKP